MNHPPSQTSTGYGRRHRNQFDGYENKYEIWGVKFLAYLRLSKLLDVITRPAGTDGPEENDVDVAARKSATHDTAYCRRKKDSVNQMYGQPFSHLIPYLLISINELMISIIHLLISINELLISINDLFISINDLLISINELLISINTSSSTVFIDINNSFIDINKGIIDINNSFIDINKYGWRCHIY